MNPLHTTQFDVSFQTELPHLKNYPQMFPFVGTNYTERKKKILFLGESHYIPGDEVQHASKTKTHLIDWYNNDSSCFYEGLANYINTRNVVHLADHAQEIGHKKPLLIYYNIKAAIKEHYPELRNEKYIFPFFSYYNYFQRPAFIEKASIDNKPADDEIAYTTLKHVTKILQPHSIIFVSRKAYLSFIRWKAKDTSSPSFNQATIGQVPHPSCAWWHKPSRSCEGKTGKQKFLQLLGSH